MIKTAANFLCVSKRSVACNADPRIKRPLCHVVLLWYPPPLTFRRLRQDLPCHSFSCVSRRVKSVDKEITFWTNKLTTHPPTTNSLESKKQATWSLWLFNWTDAKWRNFLIDLPASNYCSFGPAALITSRKRRPRAVLLVIMSMNMTFWGPTLCTQ